MKNKLYLFAHIPKTGGTSLRTHFQQHLTDQKEFIHLSDKGNNDAIKQNLLPYAKRSTELKNQAQVILGHDVNCQTANDLINRKIVRIIVFREAKTWLISRYNQSMHDRIHQRKPILKFKDWLDKYPNLYSQYNWFANHYLQMGSEAFDLTHTERNKLILSELKKFDLIINLSDLNEKIRPIMQTLHIPDIQIRKNVSIVRKKDYYSNNYSDNQLLNRLIVSENNFFKLIQFN